MTDNPKLLTEVHDNEQPLESWKEIAAYLKRTERTVKRWEKEEGLPVQRHMHQSRSSVYAYPSELDAWKAARQPEKEPVTVRLWRRPVPGLTLAAVLLLALVSAGSGPILAPPGVAAQESDGMVARQVWTGPGVDILGAPSPDGRYLTFVDWATGDLAVRDLTTGESRRLTNKGDWYESKEYAEYSTVSPDGKQVAYVWFNEKLSHELRLIGIDGSDPRVVYRNDDLEYIQPYAWSPDGNHILALFHRKDSTNRIALVSIEDGSVQVLKSLDWRYPVKMSFSPDGRYIVYDFPPEESDPQRDIFLLTADGSREGRLVDHPANDLFPTWAPDGKRVLFMSDRTGSLGAWVIQVAEGKPQGEPTLARGDMGLVVPMGMTEEGSYYYTRFSGMRDVFTATLDPGTGTVLAAPTRVSKRFVGRNVAPAWSPDGEYISYISQRGPVPAVPLLVNEMSSRVITIHSVETGEERELAPKTTSPYGLEPHWSPDGHSFVVLANDEKGRPGFYRIDAQSGDVTRILRGKAEGEIQHAILSPDGKEVFYVSAGTNGLRILARKLETGRERELYRAPLFHSSLALSPDGQTLAFAFQDPARQSDVLIVLPVTGGEPRELFQGEGAFAWIGVLAWTPDGSHLIFGKGHPPDPKVELWRIPAGGGEPQRLGLAMDHLRDLSFHPDGRKIVFTAGDTKSEVWVLENLLPEVEQVQVQ